MLTLENIAIKILQRFAKGFIQLDKNTTGHTKNVILGVVYRPPNQDIEQFIDSLKYTIDKKQNSLASFLTMASHGNHISDMSGIRYLEAPEFLKNCGHALIMTPF